MSDIEIAEFEKCRDMIDANIRNMDQIEIYVLSATGLIYYFLVTTAPVDSVKWISVIPVILTIIGALRTVALDRIIKYLNDYISTVEARSSAGWTTFYRAQNRAKWSNRSMAISRGLFWTVMLIVTFGFWVTLVKYGAFWKPV